jgi:2-polyprenyl-6-methoxyphenol hydroxylase-like FAD-dependent oxidoreductase
MRSDCDVVVVDVVVVDVVVVGGGIAGLALAALMAGVGLDVIVLPGPSRDRSQSDPMVPFNLSSVCEPAMGWAVPWASVAPRGLGQFENGSPGAYRALAEYASAKGATVHLDVTALEVAVAPSPSIGWQGNGGAHQISCRLLVAADPSASADHRVRSAVADDPGPLVRPDTYRRRCSPLHPRRSGRSKMACGHRA